MIDYNNLDVSNLPESEVQLPSRGVIYSKDSFLYKNQGKVLLKSLTNRDETIIFNSVLRKYGAAENVLIKSCMFSDKFDIYDLALFDKQAIIAALYAQSVAVEHKDINIETKEEIKYFIAELAMNGIPCESCETKNKGISLNMFNLLANARLLERNPVELGINKFSLKLPKSKDIVYFKFLTVKEFDEFVALNYNPDDNLLDTQPISSYLDKVIVGYNEETDRNKIIEYIENMMATDAKYLCEYIEAIKPGINLKQSFKCENCDRVNTFNLPIDIRLFGNPIELEKNHKDYCLYLMFHTSMTYSDYLNMKINDRYNFVKKLSDENSKNNGKSSGSNNPPDFNHIQNMINNSKSKVPSSRLAK